MQSLHFRYTSNYQVHFNEVTKCLGDRQSFQRRKSTSDHDPEAEGIVQLRSEEGRHREVQQGSSLFQILL
jgi:hypothetical protein